MALIAVDFDHVLRKGDNTPVEGARHFISRLREAGHEIMIHSCNSPGFIEDWMNDHDIRFDDIWSSDSISDSSWKATPVKPVAALYIDDRAHCHPKDSPWDDGEINSILARVEARGDPNGGF